MGKLVGGIGLIVLALFMLVGFFNTSGDMSFATDALTFLILVMAPGIGGGALVYSHFRGRTSAAQEEAQVRQQVEEAAVLRLARDKGGTLTVVDVVAETGMETEAARDALMSLVVKDFANIDHTESGEIEYSFYGLDRQGDCPPERKATCLSKNHSTNARCALG